MARRRWLAPGLTVPIFGSVVLWGLIAVLGIPYTSLLMSSEHYREFFPAWGTTLAPVMGHCTDDLNEYRSHFSENLEYGYQILDCVMEHVPEFQKSQIASATLVLGLAPPLLQIMSPSYADTAVLALRRPILALLIAGGTPAVRIMETNSHVDLIEKLKSKPKVVLPAHQRWRVPLSVTEYALALLVVANNGELAYELGVWAVCGFSPTVTTLPALWLVSAVALHLFGQLVMRTRLSLTQIASGRIGDDNEGQGGIFASLRRRFESEVTPLQYGPSFQLKGESESPLFLVMASAMYIATAVQTLWGTMILSSLVFVGVAEAAVVVLRYFASTLICRLLIICELSGMRPLEKPSDAVPTSSYAKLPQESQDQGAISGRRSHTC